MAATTLPTQSFSYLSDNVPSKVKLVEAFKERSLDSLRTPAAIIDRGIFARNCAVMYDAVKSWNADFRAHTREGTALQLQISDSKKTSAVVVSTIMEGQEIIRSGLVHERIVNDMLYGLPIGFNKLAELAAMADVLESYQGNLRILVDHPHQIQILEEYNKLNNRRSPWSVFVKIETGGKRAGVDPDSLAFTNLLQNLFASSAISVYGFYCHAGQSYGSTSLHEASEFLSTELQTVNKAAKIAKDLLSAHSKEYDGTFVLSVGSTPTAHAFQEPTEEIRRQLASVLHGKLELHAGNYPMLDLQQIHTSLVSSERVALKILSTVLSYYPGRGKAGEDEALCDAGAIAMSKDTGPSGGFGDVIGRASWKLARVSQEHGVLVRTSKDELPLEIGSIIEIIPQHACLTAANHPWYYIVDTNIGKSDEVVDIWVPWKGW
ncbi:hypothetical protein Clacol_008140 [Clathrus columnatus]|uniref:D-serine dehydratase n=1 Tax=Clathrus columnatus TaxID=1419009 RepID=A0AAV5ALB8_9AGAM|nr:hypothetical protein Clacol_008140 [Clathrus columnatus]